MSDVVRIETPHSYSSAVRAGEYVFIGLHRGFGDTFQEQIRNTFLSLEETLRKFSLSLTNIVKIHVWLKDINDLPVMEKEFRDYFEEATFPARMTSTTDFIDSDCLIMIEGTAY